MTLPGGSKREESGPSRGSRARFVDIELALRRTAVRRFLAMGTVAWAGFFVTDIIAARVHETALAYLLAIRLAGTGLGLTLYLVSGLARLESRGLDLLEGAMNPLAAVCVSLAALRCGGAESPLALGVAIVTMVRGILPAPFRKALPSALLSAGAFPIVVLVASRFSPRIATQLEVPIVLWSFVQTTVFLVLGGGVAAAGSHLLWSAKEQIDEARKLGTYRLVARIGSGGMGEVWLARQMPLNRRVALKILKESTLRDPAALRRFKREAEAASSLSHPNTIRVFDFGASDDGVFFIAMELLDGMDLEAIIDQLGPLPPERTIHFARQICGSLAEAHQRGIIHCDLKPANLFVAKVGNEYDVAKVLDFGLARLTATPGHTTVESLRGTPAFMPPEIIRGETPTPASDVYAMGAVLYWMVTGTALFRGTKFHENVLGHLETKPEPPSVRLGKPVPPDLENLILRCLAKKPEERYAGAKELDDALAGCAAATHWSADRAKASWQSLRPSLRKVPARA